MFVTKKIVKKRNAFTLVELVVVIAIILAIAALAAAFAPRVSESQNLSRAVDNLEQWLLSAKMRAKRDGLATGVRFIQAPGDVAGTYSQLQYIQQPDSLSGFPGGATLVSAANGTVTFSGVDFSLGGAVLSQGLVQPGDYLEVRDGSVYSIYSVGSNTLQLGGSPVPTSYYTVQMPPSPAPPQYYISQYENSLAITTSTTNYRILRQPRILIGEEPLTLPNNFAVITPYSGAIIQSGAINLGPEILFSPTGAVIGSNAGSGKLYLYVQDVTQSDPNMAGIIAVQCRTGFIGAYSVAPGADPFAFAESGQESGL